MGYYETNPVTLGVPAGASWYDAEGKSALASDPNWSALLEWQKSLIDFYGADNLQRFVAGAGNEFSAAQDLQAGRVAMNLDGEWRVAFIEDGAPGPALRDRAVPGAGRRGRHVRRSGRSRSASSASRRVPSTRTRPGTS